jgi:hypothetical protein
MPTQLLIYLTANGQIVPFDGNPPLFSSIFLAMTILFIAPSSWVDSFSKTDG